MKFRLQIRRVRIIEPAPHVPSRLYFQATLHEGEIAIGDGLRLSTVTGAPLIVPIEEIESDFRGVQRLRAEDAAEVIGIFNYSRCQFIDPRIIVLGTVIGDGNDETTTLW